MPEEHFGPQSAELEITQPRASSRGSWIVHLQKASFMQAAMMVLSAVIQSWGPPSEMDLCSWAERAYEERSGH